MQTSDLFGAQRDGGIAPSKANIRMMKFCFGKLTGATHKGEGVAEVPETVGAFDPRRLVPQQPFRCLPVICLRLLDGQRWCAAAAWRASLLSQYTGHPEFLVQHQPPMGFTEGFYHGTGLWPHPG